MCSRPSLTARDARWSYEGRMIIHDALGKWSVAKPRRASSVQFVSLWQPKVVVLFAPVRAAARDGGEQQGSGHPEP